MFAHRGRDQLTWNELMQQDYPASSTEPVCSRPVDAMTNLSPAAQAVLDAFRTSHTCQGCLAAALRAAADQVAPSDAMEPRNYLPMALECQRIRAELLAIAAELENQ